jgi:hypothetical protein
MTEEELQQARASKWRLDGHPVRTLDDARAFFDSVGFCLMYPARPSLLMPTFIGAWVGENDRLPLQHHAYSDPRAKEAMELMVRGLRAKAAFEAPLVDENNPFLVSAAAFPFFYALVGERNPKVPPKAGPRSEYSELACDAFDAVRKNGPVSKRKLGEILGRGLSSAGLDRALGELWAKLRITRVDYSEEDGSVWDEMTRWAPDKVWEGISASMAQSLSALLSKYMDCVVGAEQEEVEGFFSIFVSRSKVRDAIKALLAAREFSFVRSGNRSLLQIAPRREPFVLRPRAERAR